MKIINEVRIDLTSRSSNESFARVAVSSFFGQLDPTVDEVTDIKTAVSEAVTNAIVHGYKDKLGVVFITLRILEHATAYIKIRDTGCGIENIEQAMEPLFTTAANDERAGLGFAVMQSFMDSVKVFSKKERGTTIIMTKKILSRQQNG